MSVQRSLVSATVHRLLSTASGMLALALAGCATAPFPGDQSPATVHRPPSTEAGAPGATHVEPPPASPPLPESKPARREVPTRTTSATPTQPAVVAGPGEEIVEIISEPAGARVLLNNQVVGRAPMRVAVKVTSQGFCTEYVLLKVRFVAEDVAHVSQTVEAELTPREKPPLSLRFTPIAVHWTLRDPNGKSEARR